jgi:cell division protein FtsL
MYTHGNNAYQLKTPLAKRKKAIKKRPKKQRRKKLSSMVTVAAAFLVAFIICGRYVQIYGLYDEIEQKTAQLDKLETENDQLVIAIDSMAESSKIEQYATEKLGLQKISSNQVVYLEPNHGDSMQKIAKNEEKSVTKSLFGIFSGASEYSK